MNTYPAHTCISKDRNSQMQPPSTLTFPSCLHSQNITIEGASIVDGDNAATNGVIHIINKVRKNTSTNRQSCFPPVMFSHIVLFGTNKKYLALIANELSCASLSWLEAHGDSLLSIRLGYNSHRSRAPVPCICSRAPVPCGLTYILSHIWKHLKRHKSKLKNKEKATGYHCFTLLPALLYPKKQECRKA